MTNYKANLKGNLSRTGPSRQELKLRAARLNIDPKKIVDALSQILGWRGSKLGSHISRAKRFLVARSGSWTSH
jgi:hypothetical protein